MSGLLHRLHELFGQPNCSQAPGFTPPPEPSPTNEVSEHHGVLLVRLRRGSAMQLRLEANGNVLYRIVPIANVTRVEEGSGWQRATDAQVQAWLHDDSAIGRWLLAKGLHHGSWAEQLAEAAAS